MAADGAVEQLFAQTFKARFITAGAIFAAALLLGAVIVAFVRRIWRSGDPVPPDAGDELSRYRELYERGELSEEEFKKLRGLLGGEIRRKTGLPEHKKANAEAAQPESPLAPPAEGPESPPAGEARA